MSGIPKRESELKSALMLEIRKQLPDFIALRHEDVRTVGIPDLSLTGHGRTTWYEAKHGTPNFTSHGYQELTCLRLAAKGYCRYIIWLEDDHGQGKVTLIVHPKNLKSLTPEATSTGFDHKFVVAFMKKVHSR